VGQEPPRAFRDHGEVIEPSGSRPGLATAGRRAGDPAARTLDPGVLEGGIMPRTFLRLVLAGFLIATAVTVPAGAANREHLQMVADIRMLQEQVQQMQQQLGGLADALKALGVKMDDQAAYARKVVADQKLATDSLASDLRVVREKVDDSNVRLGSLGQEIEALRLAIPSGQPQAAGNPPEEAAAQATGAPAMQPGASPERMFESAWSDYTAGQYALAIAGFESYLKMFPKSPRAGEAQYTIGRAYLQDGKFDDAITAFNRVISDYPKDANVASAYYLRGQALEARGEVQLARESYEYVVKNYPPDNLVAVQAKQALERLSRKKE
jgi:tol-pal system protein YbgF